MKPLITMMIAIAVFFLALLLIIKLTGVLTVEQIESWLHYAKTLSPVYVGSLVIILLVADLFIAVPTLTVTILAGYFLGHLYGAISALTGLILAGICGYVLSRYYGNTLFKLVIKDESKRHEAIAAFREHGFAMIVLSRAVPMLPEITSCLSGITNMPFKRYLMALFISSVPYVLIVSYAGSISSIDNPTPAILATMGFLGLLWISGGLLLRKQTQRVLK